MKQYLDALQDILDNGIQHEDRTGVGTYSYFGVPQMVFDISETLPIMTTKKVAFRWIAEELFWFLSGDTNNKTLQDKGITIWNEWADEAHTSKFGREENDLGPIYGYTWRSFGGHYPKMDGYDQIERACRDLKDNPFSRRIIVSGWDPAEADNVDLPPCHTMFHFKVDEIDGEKHLSCKLYQRSADFFLGVPYNITSYALLTKILAHVMDMKPRRFIHTFGDAHIYKNHLDQVKEQMSREPLPLPKLEFVNAENLKGFDGLLNFRYENLKLIGYEAHDSIKAPVAV